MAMSKRDIAFAQCGVYLLAWLIRDADKERYQAMKAGLATIHRTLDDEDEATSKEDPDPKYRHLFETAKQGGGDDDDEQGGIP